MGETLGKDKFGRNPSLERQNWRVGRAEVGRAELLGFVPRFQMQVATPAGVTALLAGISGISRPH